MQNGSQRPSARVRHFVRAPEPPRRHRTTARVALSLLVVGIVAGFAQAAVADVPEKILFPIVGPAQWTDDFGAPRGQGSHEGNDILSDWQAPVVAVEAGKVRIHNGSERAGCMLYLYGKSGTTYLYIHLNNDLTPKNDGRGGCKPGVAFAPGLADGARVKAGELLGYVGSSGDAGATNHLHFELHPDDGGAVSPFRWLKKADRLLYVLSDDQEAEARATADALSMTVTGTVRTVTEADVPPVGEEPAPADQPEGAPPQPPETPAETQPVLIGAASRVFASGALVTVDVTGVELSTGAAFAVERSVTIAVPADAVVERTKGTKTKPAQLGSAQQGDTITLTTGPIGLSLETQLARPGTLVASRLLLGSADSENG